jgi:hypothetical protein
MLDKIYIYVGVTIAIGLLVWRFEYLSSKVSEQAVEIDQGKAREAAYELNIKEQNEKIQTYADNETVNLKTIEDGTNETNRIRKCIDDGSCVLHIRSSCPKLPQTSTNSNSSGTTESARPDAGLGQDILTLRNNIVKITANYNELYNDCSADRKNP